jgi:mono/diheme cytochrome c family protein
MIDTNNYTLIILGTVGVFLLATLVGGGAIALLASLGSRFMRRNMPSDEDLSKLRAISATQNTPRVRKPLSPTAEPLVLAAVSFVGFLVVSFLFLRAPTVMEAEVAEARPARPSLPTKGNFDEIAAGLPPGNAESGARLFVSQGCSGCHSQEKDKRIVGPSFYGLWTRAATRQPPLGAKGYLYHSIVAPNDYVVEGYQANIMQQTYATQLDPQQMSDILTWIETAQAQQ